MEFQRRPSETIQGSTKDDGPVLSPTAPARNIDPAAWLGLPPGKNISHRPDPAIFALDPAEVGAHAGSEPAADPMRMFRPVNPHAGSEGAPRGMQSDGSPVGDIMQHVFDFERGFAQEGIAGLLDMGGMLDRQAAQRELAIRFNIFGDDAIGTREQNQVSEQEFQRIARTYSDIRLGRGDLHLGAQPSNMSDDNYATFRKGAMNDLADILQTESGRTRRTLIDSLHHAPLQKGKDSHRVTTISPNLTQAKGRYRGDRGGDFDRSNAHGGGVDHKMGENGYVKYVPGQDAVPGELDGRSDVTLYHELVHAHDFIYDVVDRDMVKSGPDKDTGLWEYEATGLGKYGKYENREISENRYRGERRFIGAHNVGERNHSSEAESDDRMTRRDQYNLSTNPDGTVRRRTTPATIPSRRG